MVDRYGRPTMSDGLRLATAVTFLKREGQRDADRMTNKQSFEVADALANQKDVSGYSPEARYKGAKMHGDTALTEGRAKAQELVLSNAGMQEKLNKLNLNLQQAHEKLRVYQSARASGNDALAKSLAVQISNEHMYNGRHIEGPERGEPGYKVTNWDGSVENVADMPIEQVDELLGAYFDKPQDEIMQWQLSGEQKRRQRNEEVLAKAEPYLNEKTGQVIYKVPAGLWGPDGKPRGSFFVDGPMAQNEIPAEQAKGFVKFGVAAGKAGLEASKTSTKKARRDLALPKTVAPGNIVTQGGEAGLLEATPKGAKFQKIEGGLDISSLPGSKSTAKGASQAFNLKVKRLDTELMPFIDKGQSAIDPETLTITSDGRNALMNAIKLVQKAEDDPGSLTQQEEALLTNAARAVEIYQSISEENRQAFGLSKNSRSTGRDKVKPPPGFELD